MRIINLQAENFKRIKAVNITPQDDVIIVSGENGNGKSSVIDSIWMALEYRAASKDIPVPIRAGTDKASVTLDLGEYIVTRKFTQSGSTLEVRTPDNSKISSPQKLLDGFISSLSFDPWLFAQKKEEEQRQMIADVLYSITEGQVDLADFERKHQELFEQRTQANKEKKRLTTILTTMRPPVKDDPDQELSSVELAKSISDAMILKSECANAINKHNAIRDRITALEKELSLLKDEELKIVCTLKAMPEIPNIEFLQGELLTIEERNKRAREVAEYNKTREALAVVDKEIQGYNDKMELLSIEKAEALESSPLPVKDIKLTPEGLLVKSEEGEYVPFCQVSTAKQLRISLGIAMAANPKLRVIRISNGSLIGDANMQIIKDMARDEQYQVWIEYASRNAEDQIGVFIEDGEVKSTN